MSPLFSLLLSFIFAIHTTRSQSYPFESWMEDWSSTDASALSIEQSTIYEIVLPGAHNAAMSFSSSDTNPMTSPSSQDSYVNTLNSLSSIQAQKQWAQRQTGSILELLKSGVRFLDLQFQHEETSDTVFAYNGLLGRSIAEIVSDINEFLSGAGTKELILIYLHDFIYSQSLAYGNAQLSSLLDAFATDASIQSKLANTTSHDIYSLTIGDLINTHGVQIIIFTDQYPSDYSNSNYFYDANTYLFLPKYDSGASNGTFVKGQLDQVSEVRSFVVSNLRHGWPQDKLNLIYWTLDIGSSFTEQHIYSSMMDFSSRLNNELNNVLNTYHKLWFANIIIVDFFQISDVMEQLLLLNHEYAACKDTIWGNNATDCPALTDLKSKYSASDTSPLCQINTDLQTDCPRSCGGCSSNVGGNPGDSCANDDDCNGVLYGFYSNANGQCFIRPDTERARDNINLESFCVATDAQSSCANKDVQNKCGNNTADDISGCNQYCSANWQCDDGFCNTKYSVCMTLLESSTTTEPPTSSGSDQKYDFIVSEGAEKMLADVALFRPGDYQAAPDWGGVECSTPAADCVTNAMNANPYIASLVGFAIIPFFMALTLCFCYTACCAPCWCICDQCAKKCCCCHLVMKDPIEDDNKCKHYTPLVILGISLIVVLWACIEGIVNNAEMHDHLFGEANSVAFAVNNLFDEVIGRFEAIEPTAEYIIDSGVNIMNDIFGILESSTDSVGTTLDQLYAKLDVVAAKYSNGTALSTRFVNPFGSIGANDTNTSYSNEPFIIACDYCDGISDQALAMKDIINGSIGQAVGNVDSLMNETKGFVDAKDMIKNATSQLFDVLNEVINVSNTIQTQANEYIEMGREYDQQYREQPATIFFIIPMGLIIFVIAGVAMKNKWCFKCEWFCAMYCCGIPIMLLSWPFIFFAVLWGDICVRLDDFEQNLQHSQIGQLAGLDSEDITPDDPRAQGLALVNTCWHGGSPLEQFNLTQNLNWDVLREQLDSVTDIDLTSMLENADIASFQTGIDTLDVGEFEGKVDSFIAHANSLGEYCGCGQRGNPFTWDNLYTPPKFDYCATNQMHGPNYTEPVLPYPFNISNPLTDGKTAYWKNTTLRDLGECELAFINASAAVQIYTVLADEANLKIAEIKGLFGDAVFDTYDDLFKIAANLEEDVSQISCLTDPLFDQFDIIIDNFTNCGFLGEAYGNFKEAGCVNLFDDWYKIARAMAIVAYISIMIVFMSLCLDYIYGPVVKEPDENAEDEFYEVGDNVMEMQPTAHDNAASCVELPPGAVVQTYPPGQYLPPTAQQSYGAPAEQTYVMAQPPTVTQMSQIPPQSGPDSLGFVISPMNNMNVMQVESAPGSVHSSVVMVPPYGQQPEIAESENQNYSIEYDNEPNQAASVHAMIPIASMSGPQSEGVGVVQHNMDMDEPVLPPERDDTDIL